jgi:hypothetical protein
MGSTVLELEAGACDQILDGLRDQDFTRSGDARNPGPGVHRHPGDLVSKELAFAGVHARSDLEAERPTPLTAADAQRIARAGPSNVARNPSPAVSTSRPW